MIHFLHINLYVYKKYWEDYICDLTNLCRNKVLANKSFTVLYLVKLFFSLQHAMVDFFQIQLVFHAKALEHYTKRFIVTACDGRLLSNPVSVSCQSVRILHQMFRERFHDRWRTRHTGLSIILSFIIGMSVFFSWFIGNEFERRTNKLCEPQSGYQVICLSHAMIHTPWTQKKDTHSLYLQCF